MDRRSLVGMFLLVSVYYLWMVVRGPSEAELAAKAAEELAASGSPAPSGGAERAQPGAPPPAPAAPVDVAAREVPFAACGAEGVYHTQHGLRSLVMPAHEGPLHVQPLYAWLWGSVTGAGGAWKPWGDPPGPEVVLGPEARALAVGVGAFGASAPLAVVAESAGELRLRGRAGAFEVEQSLREQRDGDSCRVAVTTTWTNRGADTVSDPLWVMVHDQVRQPGGSMFGGQYDSVTQPLLHVDGDLAYGNPAGGMVGGCLNIGAEDPAAPGAPVAIDGAVDWFGVADRYFGFLVLPRSQGASGHFSTSTPSPIDGEGIAGTHVAFQPTLAPGQAHQATFDVYVGPLSGPLLAAVDPTLTEAVDLGFFAFFGYPLLWLLRLYQGLVGNWGLAIILLTVTVKLVFFPMTHSSMKSMQNMQRIQPELNRIREAYANDPEAMNRLTMELMMREKVNPVAGCLPMVAQMPVWIALYQVLLSSTDLYHTDFLYLRDLSAPDPYCVLPVAVIALMVLQQSFTNTSGMDPAQARMMKIMPLLFGVLFFTFPSGLGLYMFVNMLGSILQQWWIKRSLGEYPAQAVM